MITKIKRMIWCAVAGFVIPTAAFALTEEPVALQPAESKYLFEVSYEDAEGAIGFALADKGAGQKVAATINGHKKEPIFSYSKPISVEIRGLKFDKTASRWSASLLAVENGNVITAVPVAGRFEETLEVPVLKKQIRSGEKISDADIEIRDFPVSATRSGTITDMASLIGKSPVRTLSAFRPIREQEIAMPAVVKKNDLVQIRYISSGMEISVTGEAMTGGARGDAIDVRNTASKKVVRAIVEDERTVSVTPLATQTSRLDGAQAYDIN